MNDPQYPEARDYIREKIQAGKLFIRCIGEGQSTILKIAREVVKRQQGFMDRGAAGLKPLMMAEVAKAVGVDESVVSRAVSGKYMETPQGMIAMRTLFTSGLGTTSGDELSNECVKELVAEIFRNENRKSPLSDLRQRGVGFKSICDGAIDTTTAGSDLIFNIFSSLAQFERRLIQERTKAGLTAARARGRLGGRKPIPADDPRVQTAKKMHADKSMPVADICKSLFEKWVMTFPVGPASGESLRDRP